MPIATISSTNANATVQGFLVLAVPSTNVCSNINCTFPLAGSIFKLLNHTVGGVRRRSPAAAYFTFAAPAPLRPTVSRAAEATGTAAGFRFFRLSMKSCQKIRIGLAMNIEE
jgi:hypothetical protein